MYLGVVQCHLSLFIGIFVMHIVDHVHGVGIHFGNPWTVEIKQFSTLSYSRYSPDTAQHPDRAAYSVSRLSAVGCHHQHFCRVGAGAEELHFLADAHGGRHSMRSHNRSIAGRIRSSFLILERVCVAGNLSTEFLECFGRVFGPQNSQVWFCRRFQVVQGYASCGMYFWLREYGRLHRYPPGLGNPIHGIAAEQFIVIRCTKMARHTQFHNKIIHQLLCLCLCQGSGSISRSK